MTLYSLLMSYQGKELDDNFVNAAYELMMENEESLDEFITDFKVVNDNDYRLGAYSTDTRVIQINRENIASTSPDYVPNKKILALQVIRKMMEHARNIQRLHECRDDIESTVIRYSLRSYALEHGLDKWDPFDKVDFVSLTYGGRKLEYRNLDPEERLVDIRSWKYLVNLLKNQRRTSDLLSARSNLYYSYVRGYNDNGFYIDAPTYQYLLKMGMYHQYYLFKRRVEEEKKYSFETRATYGLPLKNESEFDAKILEKVRLQRKCKSENTKKNI